MTTHHVRHSHSRATRPIEALEARRVLSTSDFVSGLYTEVLHRSATAMEVADWDGFIAAGHSRSQVADLFWTSTPHLQFEVEQEFQANLGRDADPKALANATAFLAGGGTPGDLDRMLLDSAEFQMSHASTAAFVQGLYLDVLHRMPDAMGQAAWDSMIDDGMMSRDSVAQLFLDSPARADLVLDELFEDTLHRDADEMALAMGATALEDNPARFNELAVDLLTSPEFEAKHRDGDG